MPAVLKGSVAFERGTGRREARLTLGSQTDLTAAVPFTETPSKGSRAARCALQSSAGTPEAPRLCAAKGEVATKANDAAVTTLRVGSGGWTGKAGKRETTGPRSREHLPVPPR